MVSELMKEIAPTPFKIPHKVNKLSDAVGNATLKSIKECMT